VLVKTFNRQCLLASIIVGIHVLSDGWAFAIERQQILPPAKFMAA
jgi:hypothetical protein